MPKRPRFRGEDFEGKWTLGAWAEKQILDAINRTADFKAVAYGKSGVGPITFTEIQAYWSDYLAREVHGKRPDILVFEQDIFAALQADPKSSNLLEDLVGRKEDEIEAVVGKALLGIEAESSIWEGKKMPDFGRDWSNPRGRSKPLKELKSWIAPTVIVKQEDLQPLKNWQAAYNKPIYIVHLFYDMAFMLGFSQLLNYIEQGIVSPTKQQYGAVPKWIYKTFYGLTSKFGEFSELANVVPFKFQTKGGKFESSLSFEGGRLDISKDALQEWRSLNPSLG